jgi:hypothetical protein
MSKEVDDMHACNLEMKGGLEADIDYPANYLHAPKSSFPDRPSKGSIPSATQVFNQVMRGR